MSENEVQVLRTDFQGLETRPRLKERFEQILDQLKETDDSMEKYCRQVVSRDFVRREVFKDWT